MSLTSAPAPSPIARQTRSLIRRTASSMRGRPRGPDPHVRRESFDVDDPRAQVWRRIGDGTKAGGLSWADALLQTAGEFDVVHKQRGQRGPLQANGIRVLAAILRRALDFKTGRSEPELLTLMKWTGLSKPAVVGALARLREHGFLDWVRRSVGLYRKGCAGPQRKQTSNAYFFPLTRMQARHKGVWLRFRQLLARRLASATPPAGKAAARNDIPATAQKIALDEALTALGIAVASASS